MKFIRSLIDRGSRILPFGSQNYPRRLPKDFKPIRFENVLPESCGGFASKPADNLLYQKAWTHSSRRFEDATEPSYNPDVVVDAAAQKHPEHTALVSLLPNGIGKILVAKGIITPSDLMEALERKKREPVKYLGQILAEMGIAQSKVMNQIYLSNKRKKLGEILVDLHFVTALQLHETLVEQRHLKEKGKHVYLAKLMVNNQILSQEHYMTALSAHFSMPVVSLKNYVLRPSLQKAVGERYALHHRIIVLSDGQDDVAVALAEPHLSVFDHLEKAIPRGKSIFFHLARAAEIDFCLRLAYGHDVV
jgi:hypothetical protein